MTKIVRKPQAVYDPSRFHDVSTVEEAVNLILTPEAGLTSAQRWREEAPFLMTIIEKHIKPKSMVVDYGCGIGRLAKPLIEKLECNVIGVDIAPNMLALAESCVDSDHLACMSPHMFDLLINDAADAALAVWTLQHCFSPLDDISMIKKSLKTGGKLFVLNNIGRAVPTEGGNWDNDGIKISDLLQDAFTLEKKGRLDPSVAPGWLGKGTFWAVYRKA